MTVRSTGPTARCQPALSVPDRLVDGRASSAGEKGNQAGGRGERERERGGVDGRVNDVDSPDTREMTPERKTSPPREARSLRGPRPQCGPRFGGFHHEF